LYCRYDPFSNEFGSDLDFATRRGRFRPLNVNPESGVDMIRFRLALAALTLVFASSAASAQTSSVGGRVMNAEGGALANAEVTLRTLPQPGMPARMPNMPGMAGMERTTQTGADGTFSFDQVSPGQYVLQVDSGGFERSSQEVTVSNQPQTVAVTLQPLEIPGLEAPTAAAGAPAVAAAPAGTTVAGSQALLDRIKVLEQRIADLESGTVLSEPETRVKRIEVYTDKNGNQYDQPVAGARKEVTYQRERVYRRQWLSEKLEQAFADQDAKKITVGVSAASVTQFAKQTRGSGAEAAGHAYQLGSADLLFSAGLAQYTSFFADVVGLSGAPPDTEIGGLTLLNSYTARLVRQNEVNVREAWLRTELFSQKLAISAGRLDLTNYFDRNAVANDETTQFISDALVNSPALGLAVNGAGVVGVYDPKNGFAFKAGLQQSSNEASNLSQSLYSLAEVDYVARPRGLAEGNYRVWLRNDNSTGTNKSAVGLSVDQKLTNIFGLFGRYGTTEAVAGGRDHFYSAGVQFQNGVVFYPLDFWGVGYAQTDLESGDQEKLAEGYYNFQISEKLRLSLHLQHVFESPAGTPSVGFLVPAIRLQARF
jgi:Carboxypeptidase regulatory-like domain